MKRQRKSSGGLTEALEGAGSAPQGPWGRPDDDCARSCLISQGIGAASATIKGQCCGGSTLNAMGELRRALSRCRTIGNGSLCARRARRFLREHCGESFRIPPGPASPPPLSIFARLLLRRRERFCGRSWGVPGGRSRGWRLQCDSLETRISGCSRECFDCRRRCSRYHGHIGAASRPRIGRSEGPTAPPSPRNPSILRAMSIRA